jgi:hypothetical protein
MNSMPENFRRVIDDPTSTHHECFRRANEESLDRPDRWLVAIFQRTAGVRSSLADCAANFSNDFWPLEK